MSEYYRALIRKTDTGEERWSRVILAPTDAESVSSADLIWFMWDEGNFSCDCNRESFFYDTSALPHACGDKRFKLVRLEYANGKEVPREP